jgi:GntR family transcriptional regulator, transcriptional repressor for pyruvate dehydrogenase complex
MEGTDKADRRKYLYSEVVEKIQEMIHSGELRVGDRIPPERKLARAFRVSRNCIRQAIQALAEKNILQSRRGDGTYVCVPDQSLLIRSVAQAIQVEKNLLREIVEFRLLIEPQFAYLAAKNVTQEELDRLKIIVCDQDRRNLAGQQDSDLDAAFHYELAKATKNRLILEVVNTVNGILNQSRSESLQSDARGRASVIAHLGIIDALEAGDPERALQAMKDHLLTVEQAIFGPDDHSDAFTKP